MNWLLPNAPHHTPKPAEAKRIEPVLEARHWVDMRASIGDLILYSRLFPDPPDVFEYHPPR